MVTVPEASAIIFSHLVKPAIISVEVLRSAGRVLAEPIVADRDFPPFDRVSMDGISIQIREWLKGRRTFLIESIQAAGQEQKILSDPSHCIEVMTGAILPSGCDAVIRYEDITIQGKEATINLETILAGQSIHRQSADARKDKVLLDPGITISPAEVALFAAVGKSSVKVYGYPSAAIISTGDELVEIDTIPKLHQIRPSNSYALQSAMMNMGWEAMGFHFNDEKMSMEKGLKDILQQYEVIILSGGVSMGKFDFIPQVLENIGIQKLFHQVSQRPGKPFWFGKSKSGKIAFALPGNPVSTFMCFYKYVKPWVLRSLGEEPENLFASLAVDFSFPAPLTYFLQVAVKNEEGRLVAYPDSGGGSGDFANLKNVSGFLELPLEKKVFKRGEVFPYIPFRH